jgi:hypothetical protein
LSEAPALERLVLRIERLKVTFRFTYAFHARDVRFECDRGDGFVRVFPETFSFNADRHDPAELYLQFDDLIRKPELISPAANRRDADLLASRLLIELPRYLERVLTRLEVEGRLAEERLARVYEDVALITQIFIRFSGSLDIGERYGTILASLLLRKLMWRTLFALLTRCVSPEYLEAYLAGNVDPVDPADDLSEAGFFYTLENGEAEAVNRCLVRLSERAFYRWLEDVCLDEKNDAFGIEDSPFEDRETEVLEAIRSGGAGPADQTPISRGHELSPFLRRMGNLDNLRVLKKLEAWFLRQYDVYHAAMVIKHADNIARSRNDADSILSRHSTRNYLVALSVLVSPFVAAIFAYDRYPAVFNVIGSVEAAIAFTVVLWFMLYRFCWQRDLTSFHMLVPRIAAGIIVGYLPIFFVDEVWDLAQSSWMELTSISLLMGFLTLLYLYVEVARRLGSSPVAFARARQIFLLGVLQAFGVGLIMTGLVGRFMVERNWSNAPPGGEATPVAVLGESLAPFVGELPRIIGVEPFYLFPSAIFMMTFLSFFIGTFLQLMWEDIPITEPL